MAFFKTASADIIGYKSSKQRVASPSLEKMSDWNGYRTDDGFLYVRVRAISSRVNKNWDGWPSAELQNAYKSFVGKPIFIDHNNSDPGRTRGVIVDAALHVDDMNKHSNLDPYYATAPDNHKPPTWIELLLEVDAKSFPKLAKAIISKDIDGVSMGANVEYTKCSHCHNRAEEPSQFCSHILNKGALFDYTDKKTGRKTSKNSYEDCYKVSFFEISFVFDPADETALVRDIRHAKTASIRTAVAEEGLDTYLKDIAHDAGMEYGIVEPWEAAKDAVEKAGYSERAAEIANSEWNSPSLHEMMAKTAAPVAPSVNSPNRGEGMIPQHDLTSIPQDVDTLRHEMPCPLCGNHMESGRCSTCGYEKSPEGLDNPDLTKAKPNLQNTTESQPIQGQEEQGPPQQPPMNGVPTGGLPPNGMGQGGSMGPGTMSNWHNKFGDVYDWEQNGDFDDDIGGAFNNEVGGQVGPDWNGFERALLMPENEYLLDALVQGQAPAGEVAELMEEHGIANNRQNQLAVMNIADEFMVGMGAKPSNELSPTHPQANPADDVPGQVTFPADWNRMGAVIYINPNIVINEKTAANPNLDGGRINTQEKPLLPITRQVTDKPKNQKTISDSPKPVESKTKKEN